MQPLSADDFPLVSVGPLIYRKTNSSPVLTAPSEEIAKDICERLNRDMLGTAVVAGAYFVASPQTDATKALAASEILRDAVATR